MGKDLAIPESGMVISLNVPNEVVSNESVQPPAMLPTVLVVIVHHEQTPGPVRIGIIEDSE